MRALEFFDVPDFEDLVSSCKVSYSYFRKNNPDVRGKALREEFVKILKKIYDKYCSFESFLELYPDFEIFKSKVSKNLHKKKGHSSPALKKVNLVRSLQIEDNFSANEEQKIIAFCKNEGIWQNFFENKKMLELTGHEDDW